MLRFFSSAVLVAILSSMGCSSSRADIVIDVLVPAYSNPATADGTEMWNALVATAQDPGRNFAINAILNPASGPGTSLDANYVNGSGNGPLASFHAAGGIVYGYVATNFGNRALTSVKADVDEYIKSGGLYHGYVDGIFFDEMSNDLGDVGYYQELNAYVESIVSTAKTIGNPGTTFVNNPSGQVTFTATDYMNSLDTVVTFESTGVDYSSNYSTFPYVENLNPSQIAHIIHTQANWDPSILDLAASRGAGYLYVTNDVMGNPYDVLPSYWSSFTADLQSHNLSAVPEPSTLGMLGAVSLVFLVRRQRRAH